MRTRVEKALREASTSLSLTPLSLRAKTPRLSRDSWASSLKMHKIRAALQRFGDGRDLLYQVYTIVMAIDKAHRWRQREKHIW
eukprot:2881118-Pleurochrysis_carterae.AAC.1